MTVYPPLDKAKAAKYGPWAVIAGASDGTGEAFARQLAALGLNVMLVSRRAPVLEALARSIEAAHGVETRILAQDLMSADAAQNILRAASDLDVGIYISNAGSGARLDDERVGAGFLDRPAADWRGVMTMNVNTVAEATHGFATRMAARGSGGILLMGSMAALNGLPWVTMYSATKAFEMVFAESLWGEFVGSGVKIDVLSVQAPLMDTPTCRRTAGVDLAESLDMILYQPEDVVRQALARLPHGPLLLFPLLHSDPDQEPQAQERRERVLAQLAGQALT